MITHIHKLFIAGKHTQRLLVNALPQLHWQKGMNRGFSLHTCDAKKVIGAFAWRQKLELESHDEETLAPTVTSKTVVCKTAFTIDFNKGLVWADKAPGITQLYEALDSIPDATLQFDDLNLNLEELYSEFSGAYKKQQVTGLKLADYLAEKGDLLASPMFKLLDPAVEWKLIEKFSDQLKAIRATLKLPDGACSVTIHKGGKVQVGDTAPDELLMFLRDILPRFHEAEVETVAAEDPTS